MASYEIITNSQIANINIKLIPSTNNYEKEVFSKFFKGVWEKRNKKIGGLYEDNVFP